MLLFLPLRYITIQMKENVCQMNFQTVKTRSVLLAYIDDIILSEWMNERMLVCAYL